MRPAAQRAAVAALAMALTVTAALGAGERKRIPPGTQGVVHTVVEGNVLEEIPLRFLGVYEGAVGPGYDVYLVELEGPVADRVGVAAGMSGSPVFVDGEIVGALAYRYGLLPKRAIGGVTPIEDMLDSARAATAVPAASGGPAPIGTPLQMAGLAPAVREWLVPQLERHGFVPVAGGGRLSDTDAGPGELAPGMPVGIQLVGGDISIAATGTVTWVDGDLVYAFGHPFFGSGRVAMPMTTARVVHTVSDLAGSVKLSNVGRPVGAILEDRQAAVIGRKGAEAPMIPVDVIVRGGSYGRRSFHYEVVRHPQFVPLLVSAVTSSSLINNPGHEDAQTIVGAATVRLRGLPDLPIELANTGDGPASAALGAASRISAVLAVLYRNSFAEPEVESIRIDLGTSLDRREYEVQELLYDRGPVEPGGKIAVECVLRGWRGETSRQAFELDVPAGVAPGTELRLAVGEGVFLDRALGRPISRRVATADDLSALVRAIGALPPAHRLTAVLYRPSEVVAADGVMLEHLPPTARRLLGSQSRNSTRAATLSRRDVTLDGTVTGGRLATFRVRDGAAPESP